MSSQVKVLTVEEATIKTATVEIKTLTISGKQMTLAVFRQLQEESISEREMQFPSDMNVWGRVNYHPDKCADYSEHIHIIWQKKEELRRC